jgi:hypothetical protein
MLSSLPPIPIIDSSCTVGESAYDVRTLPSDFLELFIEPPPAKNGEDPTARLLTGRVDTLLSDKQAEEVGTRVLGMARMLRGAI